MDSRKQSNELTLISQRDDGHRVWRLPNSKEINVIEPREPKRGGPPPASARQLITELGMPEDAKWVRLPMSGSIFGEKWGSYELEFFGMYVPANENGEYPWPFWSIFDKNGRVPPLVVQIWRQVIRHENSSVFGEILWSPSSSIRVSVRGLEHSALSEDIELARQGLSLLIAATHSGRPFGSTSLTNEEFCLRAPIECKKWMERFDGKCRDVDLAEALGIGKSTLYGYLKRAGLTMKDIREQST